MAFDDLDQDFIRCRIEKEHSAGADKIGTAKYVCNNLPLFGKIVI